MRVCLNIHWIVNSIIIFLVYLKFEWMNSNHLIEIYVVLCCARLQVESALEILIQWFRRLWRWWWWYGDSNFHLTEFFFSRGQATNFSKTPKKQCTKWIVFIIRWGKKTNERTNRISGMMYVWWMRLYSHFVCNRNFILRGTDSTKAS